MLSDEQFLEIYFTQIQTIWTLFNKKKVSMAERDEYLKPWRDRLNKITYGWSNRMIKSNEKPMSIEDEVIQAMIRHGVANDGQTMKGWFEFNGYMGINRDKITDPDAAALELIATGSFKMYEQMEKDYDKTNGQ